MKPGVVDVGIIHCAAAEITPCAYEQEPIPGQRRRAELVRRTLIHRRWEPLLQHPGLACGCAVCHPDIELVARSIGREEQPVSIRRLNGATVVERGINPVDTIRVHAYRRAPFPEVLRVRSGLAKYDGKRQCDEKWQN